LILVGMDDDLYASTLPLPKLRYCLVGANVLGGRYGMPFEYMGIVLTAAEFDDPARWTPVFRQRLREWGIETEEPIGTLIAPASPEELAQIIRSHPDSDFLVPARYRNAVEEAARASHEVVEAPEHFFLLSRQGAAARATAPEWSCRL
jgi:hypothetical protein